ncbi:MAG: hypothetical protein IIU49_00280 [Spirochaetales bacterium]|nr:hypothetical protein [Spirochaetales bacterium]
MIYSEFIEEVRKDMEDNLNPFLTSVGMDAVSAFCTDGFSVERSASSIAVYAFSPDGPVMEYDGMYQTVRFTVEFFLDNVDEASSLSTLEGYFSALAFYITQRRYGGNGIITNSQLTRMDQGGPCNECLFLVESRINTSMDYEDSYPVSGS